MRPDIFGLGLSTALAFLSCSAALAADYQTPLRIEAGSKIDVTITRTRSGSNWRQPTSATFRYRQDVTPAAEGYRVRQRMVDAVFPADTSPAEKAELERAAAVVGDLTFLADESLGPLRIEDWSALGVRMGTAMGKDDPAAAIHAMRFFASMTPEAAAETFMREQMFVSGPQNLKLDLGEPLSGASPVLGPLDGRPVQGVVSARLENIDRDAQRAVIRTSETLDPISSAPIRQALMARAAGMPAEVRPSPDALAALKLERTFVCRSEMDLVTGLAVTTDCTETILGVDRALRAETRVDRWVITQQFVKP